jgi:hypothetical protein
LGGLFVIFLMLPYHYQLNKSFLVVMFWQWHMRMMYFVITVCIYIALIYIT